MVRNVANTYEGAPGRNCFIKCLWRKRLAIIKCHCLSELSVCIPTCYLSMLQSKKINLTRDICPAYRSAVHSCYQLTFSTTTRVAKRQYGSRTKPITTKMWTTVNAGTPSSILIRRNLAPAPLFGCVEVESGEWRHLDLPID